MSRGKRALQRCCTLTAGGRAHGTVYGPPSPVNVLHHLYSLARGATQDLNDANYNLVVPGILITNVYRDLAIRWSRIRDCGAG
jgi:hypothetical protein